MMAILLEALRLHPGTCVILCFYAGNVVWYATQKHWGLIVYWSAASLITFSATWLRGWEG